MADDRFGILEFEDALGSVVMRFARTLPVSTKRVWRHLVDREHLHEWLASEPGGHIRHRVGGEVVFQTAGGATIDSWVDEFEPEAALAFGWQSVDWQGGEVMWMLEAAAPGTTVIFEHAEIDDDGQTWDHYARTMATWHQTCDRFEASVSGKPVPVDSVEWERLYRLYARWLTQEYASTR